MSTPGYEAVLRVLRERSGLEFPPNRRGVAQAAIDRAMRRAGEPVPEAYAARVSRDAAAMAELLAEVTVGETYFFREPGQLAFVRDHVLPEITARRGPGHRLRAWSAGCATGEEAYTLAMLAAEAGLEGRMEVLGTDVSEPRLAVARRGRYSRWSMRGVSEAAQQAWFTRVQGEWEVLPRLRRGVSFQRLNLADARPSASPAVREMDLVLCRNVLIYLSEEAVAAAARRLVGALSEGGWLVPGASDPAFAELVACEVVTTGAGLVYRRLPGPVGPPRRLYASAGLAGIPVTETDFPAPPAPSSRDPGPRSWEGGEVAFAPTRPPSGTAWELPVELPGGDAGVLAEAEDAYAAREYARAAALASEATRRVGGTPRAWVVRVRALANQGRVAEAAGACTAAVALHRTDAELAYLHALLLLEVERPGDALAAVRRALYLEPGMAAAHLLQAGAAARLGRTGDARRALRNAERLLAALPQDEPVAAADGETAARMLGAVRARLAVLPPGDEA